MKAIRIDGQTPGGTRSRLADLVPLDTPFSVQVFPVYGCNLACAYCLHSLPVAERGFVAETVVMDETIFRKCMDDLSGFPRRLKMLRFAGTGEPLLHPRLADMIAYARRCDIAESVDVVTNGVALTQEMSRAFIRAGLHRIRFSIQGLDDSAYSFRREQGVFHRLVENIRYIYHHRGDMKIYVKIIDCALPENGEERFLEIFGDIADFIAVEHLIPAVDKIDYSKLGNAELTQNGAKVAEADVCPQPFYMMQINPDGKVVPCCAMETAYIAGDAQKESLLDIWKGEKLRNFQRKQLAGEKSAFPVCAKCQQYRYAMFDEDVLDGSAEEILGRLGCKGV